MKKEPEKIVRRILEKLGVSDLTVERFHRSVRLCGKVSTWDEKIQAGYAASGRGFKSVINDIDVEGIRVTKDPAVPEAGDKSLEGRFFDVLIVGAGVIGCAAARELSRYRLTVAVVEKECDVAMHTSGRNDGMIHPGFAPPTGSLKAKYNVRGNRMYDRLCEQLDVPFDRPGSLVLFSRPWYRLLLPLLFARARRNGVDGCKYLSRSKVAKIEPWLTEKQHGALFFPSAGRLSPYVLTSALAENAVQNGVELYLETGLTGLKTSGLNTGETASTGQGSRKIVEVETTRGICRAKVVINAAGMWADWVAALAGDRFFSLHGRKGVDAILDSKTGRYQQRIAAMPSLLDREKSKTKGGGIVPTIEGNILVGPTAREVPERDEYETDPQDLSDLFSRFEVNRKLSPSQVITYFAGIRACTWEEDFIIERSEGVQNLVHLAGIQSPGLASAPAIAADAVKLCIQILEEEQAVEKREDFHARRKGPVKPAELSDADRDELIKRDPAYGRIVCRCEEVSEGEVRDVMKAPVPVLTIDGIKRRTRAGTGRCHGGFCTPRIIEIMMRELQLPVQKVTKRGGAPSIILTETKKGRELFHG